jgi:hypothetical protein
MTIFTGLELVSEEDTIFFNTLQFLRKNNDLIDLLNKTLTLEKTGSVSFLEKDTKILYYNREDLQAYLFPTFILYQTEYPEKLEDPVIGFPRIYKTITFSASFSFKKQISRKMKALFHVFQNPQEVTINFSSWLDLLVTYQAIDSYYQLKPTDIELNKYTGVIPQDSNNVEPIFLIQRKHQKWLVSRQWIQEVIEMSTLNS